MRNFSQANYACHILLTVLAIATICHLAGCGTFTNLDDPLGPLSQNVSYDSPTYRGQEIVIISYNIELGKKIDLVILEIEQDSIWRSVDIILIQEATLSALELLAEKFRLNYAFYPAAEHSKWKISFGNAVLSRWAIKDPTKIMLPHLDPLRKQARIGTAATIIIGKREIRVVSAHTEMFRMGLGARLDQIDSLASAIDTSFAYLVMGGDFNTVRREVLYKFDLSLDKIGMVRATSDAESTSEVGPLGMIELYLDHIYTKGFMVTGSGVLTDTKASDHHPVWITGRFARGQ